MTLPSIIVLALLMYGLFRPIAYLVVMSFAFLSLGSLAVVPPQWVGGVTLLPGPVAFIFIIIKTILSPGGGASFFRTAFSFRMMGYLTGFTVVAVAGAFILPKVFLGDVLVFTMRPESFVPGLASPPEPLKPASSNITQAAYMTISYLTAVSFAVLTKTRSFLDDFRKGILAFAAGVIITGFVDYIFGMVGLASVLDMFRTASYAILSESSINGMRRIIGLMPEASSYGAMAILALSLLIFCRNIFTLEVRNKYVFPLAFTCAALAAMCTSSTAYVALAVVLVAYFWDASARLGLGSGAEKLQTVHELMAIGAISLIGLVAIVSLDETREIAYKMLDDMVFKKGQSSSYMERNSWNERGMAVFFETNGAGVGVGSARTSNFFVNVLASTGVIGTFFFAGFLLHLTFIKCKLDSPQIQEVVRGAKLTILPAMAAAGLSGTTADYTASTGVLFGIVIGAATMVKRGSSEDTGIYVSPGDHIREKRRAAIQQSQMLENQALETGPDIPPDQGEPSKTPSKPRRKKQS